MKFSIISYLFFLGTISSADIIKCDFTEPFISTEYSTNTLTLTEINYASSEDGKPVTTVTKNVSFQIMGPGSFQLLSDKKKVLQTLTLDFQGSDGMSDTTYPYSAKYHDYDNLFGGCESNFLRKKADAASQD